MKKYIDAEELKDNFICQADSAYSLWTLTGIVNDIDNMSAADVVEVVRCKECKYREKEQPGMVYCPNTVGGWLDDEWFCAGGEKDEE